VGQEHQGLQVTGIQDHMGYTSAMGPVSSGFHPRMFQIAPDHGKFLSYRYFFAHDILIENEGGNQKRS
jgi:hypothetical protein